VGAQLDPELFADKKMLDKVSPPAVVVPSRMAWRAERMDRSWAWSVCRVDAVCHAARPFASRIVRSMRRVGPPMFLAACRSALWPKCARELQWHNGQPGFARLALPPGLMTSCASHATCHAARWLSARQCRASPLVAFCARRAVGHVPCWLPRAVLAATWQVRELRSHVQSDLVDEAKWILKSVTA
jgi:hypothetical protein